MTASVFCAGCVPAVPGMSSGLISVSRMSMSTADVSGENTTVSATQRIRCWIRVLGTLALTL